MMAAPAIGHAVDIVGCVVISRMQPSSDKLVFDLGAIYAVSNADQIADLRGSRGCDVAGAVEEVDGGSELGFFLLSDCALDPRSQAPKAGRERSASSGFVGEDQQHGRQVEGRLPILAGSQQDGQAEPEHRQGHAPNKQPHADPL